MLKIGIVGVGHFGRYHLSCLKLSDKFELIGFYDINAKVCEDVQKEYGVQAFKTFDELIRNVDVIDIVTPASTHFEYANKAISLNKHVFVEKPLARSYSEALALSKMLDSHPVKLQVGHIERFNPAYTAARPYLHEPVNVEVERMGTYNLRNKDVSVVEDLMIHDIDIILQSVSAPISKISAEGKIVKSTSFDIVDATIEFENGAKAHLKANRVAETQVRFSKFTQKGSSVFVDYMNKIAEITRVNGNGHAKMNGNGHAGPHLNGHAMIRPQIIEINAIKEELETFYNSIVNNTTPPVTIDDSLRVLKICEEIRKGIEK